MARHLTLLALLIGLSLSAFAQAQSKLPPCPKPDYSKNVHLGVGGRTEKWHNCYGRYVAELNDANKGDVYEGEFQNGWFNGQGAYYYLANNKFKGDKYEGEFRNGFHNGQGTYYFLANNQFKGDKHVGEYRDGKKHGHGTYYFANGEKHVGEYKDEKKHGQGVYYFANGDKYLGEFKDDKSNGQGTYTFATGEKYVGEFKDWKKHGQGTNTFADGRVQEGIWADDKFVRAEKVNLPPINQQTDVAINEEPRKLDADRKAQSKLPPCPAVDYSKNTHTGVGGRTEKWHNCFGRYVLELNDAAKGSVFEGEFSNGLPNGRGTLAFASGDKYMGDWKDGKFNGQGTYNHANGDKYVGEFKDDNKHGQGTYTHANGNKYVGEFKDGKYNGLGSSFNKGESYVGEFKDGKYNGQGSYTLPNGDKYVGVLKDNKRNGQGIFTFTDGRVQEGVWVDDNFVRAEKVNLPPIIQQTDVAINEERRKLDADRQALEVERQRLTEERNRREQAKQTSKLSLQTTTTNPDANGVVIISVRTNADTSSLKVNGEEQGGRPDGNYVIKKVARVGQDTNYVITAVDTNGNTDSTSITVARQAVPQSSNITASLKPENIKRTATRDSVAIIIGIQNYKRVPKADFANNDAKEFYEYAIRGLGIKPENIKLLLDEEADEIEIVKAFQNWLPLQVTKNKTDVYVFYSGHGLPSEDGQSLYFLPYGVDKQFLSRTAVGQKEVVSALVASKPKSVTMFIDACYSGQTRGGETLLASAKPIALKTDTNLFPTNFTVISASANDQISSSSPELKHGIFSFYLMKGMEGDADGNKDGKITAGEMQEYLSDKVSRQAMSMSRKQDTQLVGDANKVLMGR